MIRMTVQNLGLHCDSLTLLDEIEIEARPGRIHLVAGPSGSGKTLLGRTLAGLEPNATGEIYLDGRDVIDIPPGLRRVAWVSAENSLWPGYSAGSNIEFGLKQRRIGRLERRSRVSEALGWFGADSLKHQRVESLNPLESKRVALARALALDPQVIVIDEPLANLPDDQANSLRENLVRVQSDQRITTILLTRHADAWWNSIDRISLIDQGRIIQYGMPDEVLHRPANEISASFFGGCNLIEGVVEAVDPKGEALVRLPLGRLLGRTVSSGASLPKQGDRVIVMIRPESIGLVGSSAGTGAQTNRVPVRVVRTNFAGSLTSIDLEAPGETMLLATATVGHSTSLRPEMTLTAMIPAELVSVGLFDSSVSRPKDAGIAFEGNRD